MFAGQFYAFRFQIIGSIGFLIFLPGYPVIPGQFIGMAIIENVGAQRFQRSLLYLTAEGAPLEKGQGKA